MVKNYLLLTFHCLPFSAVGPLQCQSLLQTSVVTMAIPVPIVFLLLLGCANVSLKLNEPGWPDKILYTVFCCNFLSLILLIGLTIYASSLAFQPDILRILVSDNKNESSFSPVQRQNCQLFAYAPLGSITAVYVLCVLYCVLLLWNIIQR